MDGNASLWAIDPSGDELWKKSIPAMSIGGGYGASSDLSVSIDLDRSLYLAIGGTIHALDPDGGERWNNSDNKGYARLAIGEDHLFVVDGTYLDILDKDGEWIATYIGGINQHIYLTPIVLPGDNVIILTSYVTYSYFWEVAIINATGVRIWNYPLDNSADGVVIDDQDRMYIVVGVTSIYTIGERELQADILAWDIMWGLSIVFASIMLVLFIHSIRSDREVDGGGQETRRLNNKKLGNILRGIGCSLMFGGLFLGWALYGPYLDNYALFGVFNHIGLPVTVLLAFAYFVIILASGLHAKWGIAQFVVLSLITAVMLLSDPLQTVQGAPNDGWVPQISFVMAWLGTGLVLLSGRYYAPGLEEEEPSISA
jgi:hypothetical protein